MEHYYTEFQNVLFWLYSTNKFKVQHLKCAKGGEACRCKFEEGCTLCKKLLLLDVWIDLWNPEELIPRWSLGGGEISVGCQKSGSFQFSPCKGWWFISPMTQCRKKSFQKQHFCNLQPNMWSIRILSNKLCNNRMYETNDWSIFVKLCGVTFSGQLWCRPMLFV